MGPAIDMAFLHRRPLLAVAVGLLAATAGSLHATGALLASDSPSTTLLALGVSGLVVVFAGCANLPYERARRIAIRLFATSVLLYVPWLGYAMATATKPVPLDAVGATLSGLLAAAVAATAAASGVLACHRLELLLGWRESPERRLLSEREYEAFVRGAERTK